ncbi:MAG TPA: diguanylate cyclase [Thermodesulfovibrionales bacterium]|nr:diguanylate cyclase [Thermodesulfovibrionales bacterium]
MGPAEKILVVEDEPEIRNLLSIFCSSKGYSCETASDGNEALEKAAKTAFDAVITDISMPNMDGLILTRELLRRYPGISVMVMTGFARQYTEEDALQAGAADFIEKPFSLDEFSARFQRMMRDRRPFSESEQIEVLRNEVSHLKNMAFHDTLTGLPNRTLFLDLLAQFLETAKRYCHMLGLLFLDLDRFKDVNDLHGHSAGDILLTEVSRRLKASVRRSDIVARFGGDEFTVTLVYIDEPREAAFIARRIIESLTAPFDLAGSQCSIGVSIGISIYPSDGDDADTLMKKADAAMYRVKKQGRSDYQFYGSGENDLLKVPRETS